MWDSVKPNRATSTLPTCHSVKIEYCQDTYLKDLPKQGTEDSPWPLRPTATVRPPCNSKEWYRPGSAHRSWWKGSLKASGAGYKSHRKSPFEFHCFPSVEHSQVFFHLVEHDRRCCLHSAAAVARCHDASVAGDPHKLHGQRQSGRPWAEMRQPPAGKAMKHPEIPGMESSARKQLLTKDRIQKGH